MKALVISLGFMFAGSTSAYAHCQNTSPTCYTPAAQVAAPIASPRYETYTGPTSYAGPAPTAHYGGNYAPVHAAYHPQGDEVIVYEERRRRKQSYYFNPRDYRSFKCRNHHYQKKCSFEFRGNNAQDVEYYLAQALYQAAGNRRAETHCQSKRRGDRVTCAIRGDLRGLDTRALRYALYGR